jgi:ABC-2 type transport system permease protein
VSAVYLLWLREVRRYFRSPGQIFAALGQPLLYLVALGFGLGPVFARSGEGPYIQFLAPGVIGMTILFAGSFSGIGLLWDRQFGFLKATLVAPVPRLHVMIGRTLGTATITTFQGLLVLLACMVVGFRPASVLHTAAALPMMVLAAVVFCSMGTIIGSCMRNMQAFPLLMNFLVLPMFLLSGALYPLNDLPLAMQAVTGANPLSYAVDGLRSVLLGVTHFGLALDLGVLGIVALAFVGFGAWSFSRIEP